jgi:hypothetical protein
VGSGRVGMEHQVPQLRELMTTFRVTQRHRGGLLARGGSAPNAESARLIAGPAARGGVSISSRSGRQCVDRVPTARPVRAHGPPGSREWQAVPGAGRCSVLAGPAGRRTTGSAVAMARLAVADNGGVTPAGVVVLAGGARRSLPARRRWHGDGPPGPRRARQGVVSRVTASPPASLLARGCGRSAATPARSAGGR